MACIIIVAKWYNQCILVKTLWKLYKTLIKNVQNVWLTGVFSCLESGSSYCSYVMFIVLTNIGVNVDKCCTHTCIISFSTG